MAQRSKRPWLPFIVAGVVLAGAGFGLLLSGLTVNLLASIFMQESLSTNDSSLAEMANLYSMYFLPFVIIGIISMPIGLVLLRLGMNKKKKWDKGA